MTINANPPGYRIPDDFTGLGFETASVLPNRYGVSGYFFSPQNTELITLFRNMGVKNIRVGGGTVDTGGRNGFCSNPVIPTETDIDNLFQFAEAAGVNVIYSFRLNNPAACSDARLVDEDAKAAKYIWDHYRGALNSISISNEPDWHAYHTYQGHDLDPAIYEAVSGTPGSAYPSFLADWKRFAKTIELKVPGAKFSSPDTGDYTTRTYTPDPATGVSWSEQFAKDEQTSGVLKEITQHHYVGASPKSTTTEQAIDNMLSANWVNGTAIGSQPAGTNETTTYIPYPWIYKNILAPVLADGAHYRMTEANDYLHGVTAASDGYAAALWALDYMHWWAAHGAAGINFHNNPWLPTDTVVPSPNPCPASGCKNYHVTPKGYAIKAFELGGHGDITPVEIFNPKAINVTAYAVKNRQDLFVTIINKTHQSTADSSYALITIVSQRMESREADDMVLTNGDPGNPMSMHVTLGGAEINNNVAWQGQWTPLHLDKDGNVALTVEPTTAVVVRIHAAEKHLSLPR